MFSKLLLSLCVLMLIVSCGGQVMPPPVVNTITSAQVFYSPSPCSAGQQLGFWLFHNGYGDRTSIMIWCPGSSNYLSSGSVVWSYDKLACRAYWQPGVCGAHLDFVLSPQADGSYTSSASLITFPQSCPWCGGWTKMTADIQPVAGEAPPYLIIPAGATVGSTTVVDTDYLGYGKPDVLTFDSVVGGTPPPPTHWRTASYIEAVSTAVYSGNALVSEQWEGPCFQSDGTYFAAPSCNHEKWYFAPGWGLVKVEVLAQGSGEIYDRNLDMSRI